MVVAVNVTSFISGSDHELLTEFLQRFAQHPSPHSFFFITDDPQRKLPHLLAHVKLIVSRPLFDQPFYWKFWYNRTLPKIVKRLRADVVIHAGGACCMRGAMQQLVFTNEYFLPQQFGAAGKRIQKYFEKYREAILTRADQLLVGSLFMKEQLGASLKDGAGTIEVLYPAMDDRYSVADYFNKEVTKETITEGKEYFLFSGPISGHESLLINLLKAFSFFKKRQKSNMQLVLLPAADDPNNFVETLRTYKYRHEVKLITAASELERRNIIAAAYAFVHPLPATPYSNFVFQALQCGLPMILSDAAINKEIAGDAALYVDPSNFMDVANNLMLLFKDEGSKTRLELQAVSISSNLRKHPANAVLSRILTAKQ